MQDHEGRDTIAVGRYAMPGNGCDRGLYVAISVHHYHNDTLPFKRLRAYKMKICVDPLHGY